MNRKGSASTISILLVLVLIIVFFPVIVSITNSLLGKANLEVRVAGVPEKALYGAEVKGNVMVKNAGPAIANEINVELTVAIGPSTYSKSWALNNLEVGREERFSFAIPAISGRGQFVEFYSTASIEANAKARNADVAKDAKRISLWCPSVRLDIRFPGWDILSQKHRLNNGKHTLLGLTVIYEPSDPDLQFQVAVGYRVKESYSQFFEATVPTANRYQYDSLVIWLVAKGEVELTTSIRTWNPRLPSTEFRVMTGAKSTTVVLEVVAFWQLYPTQYVILPDFQTITLEILGQ